MTGPQSFIGYWNAVEAKFQSYYRCLIADTDISADDIAAAQDEEWTPEDAAVEFGKQHDLIRW